MKKQISHLTFQIICYSFLYLIFVGCANEKPPAEVPEMNQEEMVKISKMWSDSAMASMYRHWEWTNAESAFKKALESNPQNGEAHAQYAWFNLLKADKAGAYDHIKKSVAADPQNPLWPTWHAWIQLWDKNKEGALTTLDQALKVDSSFAVAHFLIGVINAELGNEDLAQEAFSISSKNPQWVYGTGVGHALLGNTEEALAIADQLSENVVMWNTWGLAEIYGELGDKENALKWLNQAFEQRHPYIPWMKDTPAFDFLYDEPSFKELVAQLKLPVSI